MNGTSQRDFTRFLVLYLSLSILKLALLQRQSMQKCTDFELSKVRRFAELSLRLRKIHEFDSFAPLSSHSRSCTFEANRNMSLERKASNAVRFAGCYYPLDLVLSLFISHFLISRRLVETDLVKHSQRATSNTTRHCRPATEAETAPKAHQHRLFRISVLFSSMLDARCSMLERCLADEQRNGK